MLDELQFKKIQGLMCILGKATMDMEADKTEYDADHVKLKTMAHMEVDRIIDAMERGIDRLNQWGYFKDKPIPQPFDTFTLKEQAPTWYVSLIDPEKSREQVAKEVENLFNMVSGPTG